MKNPPVRQNFVFGLDQFLKVEKLQGYKLPQQFFHHLQSLFQRRFEDIFVATRY